MSAERRELAIAVGERAGSVDAILDLPADAARALVLAHGAGAGMRHPFLEGMARSLGGRGIATLRYQFPYMQSGGRRPDPPAVLHATVRAAVETARRELPGLALLAGGKSMGGRMTSQAAAAGGLPGVAGLVFLGFPLHVAKAPATSRADHLDQVPIPMLFLQGTRDALAEIGLVREVVARLGERATLHVLEGADHSFAVARRSGLSAADVRERLAEAIVRFWDGLGP